MSGNVIFFKVFLSCLVLVVIVDLVVGCFNVLFVLDRFDFIIYLCIEFS